MTPRELKKAMKQQRRELKARVRAQLDANPLIRAQRRRRLIRRVATAVGLLLLLLFVRCDCGEGPAPVPSPPDAGVPEAVKPKPKPPVKVKPGPITGKVDPQPRGAMNNGDTGIPAWLDEFRMQVAARSPRLAECFTGIERPGALRWSAAVNPKPGTVADHSLEPVGVGTDLTADQRTCVQAVLSSPVYRLTQLGDEPLPRRVSLVIEF